jgi:riboflavin kinase/FMN adenylyltransferase
MGTAAPARASGWVVAIGNFDGVHKGHQALIREASSLAHEHQTHVLALTFSPHPAALLGRKAVPLLCSLEERTVRLLEAGANGVWVLPFNEALASLTPEAFVRSVLVEGLGVVGVVTGPDFRFGRSGAGSLDTLAVLGQRFGFQVRQCAAAVLDGIRISSTGIRQQVSSGLVELAWSHLGRPFQVDGTVQPGDRRGRELGFPTANLVPVPELALPAPGVYVVDVWLQDVGTWHQGVANVGRHPTFGGDEVLVEVHLLDAESDLYGRRLSVRFLKRLRDEKSFASATELMGAISGDVQAARSYFRNKQLPVQSQ